MIKYTIALTSIAIATLTMTGCSNPSLSQAANDSYNNAKFLSKQGMNNLTKQSKFSVNEGRYVNKQSHAVHPSWYKRQVNMHAYQQPLASIINNMTKDSGLQFTYDDQLDQQKINIDYKGTLFDALKYITNKNNINFTIDSKNSSVIHWTNMETKTFNIAYLPGRTSFNVGGGNTAAGGPASSSSNSLTGSVNVWDDLQKTLTKMTSKEGHFDINQSDSSITVVDKPVNMMRISRYIKNYNNSLSQRVAIKVKIIEVQLNKKHQYGLNWDLIYKGMSYGGLTHSASASIPGYSLSKGVSTDSVPSKLAGSSFLINAFDEQGKTTVVNEPTVTTLNNTPSTISVTNKESYIKSTNVENSSNSSGTDTKTYTATPDTIETGLKMTLIPHIKGDNVYLSINGNLSSLVKMETKSFGFSQGTVAMEMQLPNVNEKSFNQQVMVKNNKTIVMSGLKTKINSDTGDQNFYISALGKKEQLSDQKEMIVFITPTIIR